MGVWVMNNREFENLIKKEFDTLSTPDRKMELLEDIQFVTQNDASVYKKNYFKQFSIILCASFAFIFAFTFLMQPDYDYVVSLDVNPSIELQIDKNERVSNYICHNEDGEIVLEDMDLKGTDIDVAVNAIIGSMYRNGYITELKNSILVSVQGKDESVRMDMKEKIVQDIKDTLSLFSLDSYVIAQDVESDKQNRMLAKKYDISVGKVCFINEIIEVNPKYKFEDLVHLSIDEIDTLIKYSNIQFNTITTDGVESRHGFLSENQVQEKVYEHAKVNSDDVIEYKIDLISEDSRLLYHVTFKDSYGQYEYKVNAVSGSIVYFNMNL